jgi:hypothetical protein
MRHSSNTSHQAGIVERAQRHGGPAVRDPPGKGGMAAIRPQDIYPATEQL